MEISQSSQIEPKYRRPDALGELRVLPDELICSIMETLSPNDIARLSCVSSVMYLLCNEEPLWMTLCLRSATGPLEYRGSWKNTTLYHQHRPDTVAGSCRKPLHFDGNIGFFSLFLYKRLYRCFTTLGGFYLDKGDVERKIDLSAEDFHNRFDCRKPVLLTGLAESWPARTTWTTDQLLCKYGDTKFKISQRSSRKITMKFKDYISYTRVQHDEDPLYIFDDKFGEVAPTLLDDYCVPQLFQEDYFDVLDMDQRPPFRWLIIGPERSGASWHVDPVLTSAWNTLLSGRKRWALYPPGRVPLGVTVHVNEEDGDVNVESPTSLQWWLDIYPLLSDQDKPIECTQLPGETIYVPSGWWHCVLNLETTIAVTQNFVNAENFEFACLDMAPGHRHKGVCRAGLLALDHSSPGNDKRNSSCDRDQQNDPDMVPKEKRHRVTKLGGDVNLDKFNENSTNGALKGYGNFEDFSYSIDFLSLFLEEERDHYNSTWSPNNCIGQREMRQWLHKLWVRKPGMRNLIWKGACLALNADKWSVLMEEICSFHNIPSPLDDEKLPVGTGSNPVNYDGFMAHLGGGRGVPSWERHQQFSRRGQGHGLHPLVDTPLRDRQEPYRPVGVLWPFRHPYATRALTKQTHDLHLKVPEFDGKSDAYAFIDWLDKSRRSQGYLMITELSKLRRDMIKWFILMNYDEIIFGKLQSLKMGLSTIDDYADQFDLLESRARLHEIEQQRVSRDCTVSQIGEQATCKYHPLVPASTTTTAIPTVTGHVGLVVDGMRESVIVTVQRVLQYEDDNVDDFAEGAHNPFNTSQQVYLTANSVVKIYVEEGLESCIHGLGTELEFYSLLHKVNSTLKDHIPDVLASGILFQENGCYKIVPWDGKGVPDVIAKCNLIMEKSVADNFPFGVWSKNEFECRKAGVPVSDSLNSAGCTKIWPYIITARCKGDILGHIRETLSWDDALNLASFLGDQMRNLHLLPPPSLRSFPFGKEKIGCNIRLSEVDNEASVIPAEWGLFIETLNKRKMDVSSRLAKWGDPIPSSLIEKVEEYIPDDLSMLLNIFKDENGELKACKSSCWIHSDIMDDNIYMEPYTSFSGESTPDVTSLVTNGSSGNVHNGSSEQRNWRPSHLLDFSDLSIGECFFIACFISYYRITSLCCRGDFLKIPKVKC
ncbi:hypothetical protein GIB67_043012 [Kingdonia uniflora]|uniref:F-box protein n=1 Tax=Kingdonia uniflora TaxID=39325 RepID=A0A7J7NTL2_9MAGN|nr:hypothetical protein GIB67_043012 [Kingdonia uniflora]